MASMLLFFDWEEKFDDATKLDQTTMSSKRNEFFPNTKAALTTKALTQFDSTLIVPFTNIVIMPSQMHFVATVMCK